MIDLCDGEQRSNAELDRALTDILKGPTPKEVFNGGLTGISEFGLLERHAIPVNPVSGPVGIDALDIEQVGSYKRFHVAREGEERAFQYYGVILSDSVGSEVSVYQLSGRILIHDRDLQRWYR